MLSKLSIKQKLILIMSIPLAIVILLAAKLTYDSYMNTQGLKKLEKVVVLSTKIGTLVHETQKERGMTAGFLGSNGQKFKSELPHQREETSKKSEELLSFLNNFDKSIYGEEFNTNLKEALDELQKIADIRNSVTTLNIEAAKAIGYYTNTNTKLLNLISTISKLSNTAEVSQDIVSYMNFLLLKERAGIERALGTNTFAQNSFGAGVKERFLSLIAAQDTYLDVFLKIAPAKSKEFYTQTVQGNSVNEVLRMRTVALYQDKITDFGIEPSYWFEQMTQKINQLKTVEDFLAQALTNTIVMQQENANFNLIIFGILSGIGVALTLILARTNFN